MDNNTTNIEETTSAVMTTADKSSSLTIAKERKRRTTCGSDSDETTAKRPRKNKTANDSFRYWQVEVEDSNDSTILEAAKTNVQISRILSISPTKVGLKFVKSMNCQQVRDIVKDYHCGEIIRMDCAAFRKLDKKKIDIDESSNPRVHHSNSYSYYTFTTVGRTFDERVTNVKKILNMSPVKKLFSHGGQYKQHVVSPRGIKDIHFFEIDLAEGCFTVRNEKKVVEPKKVEEQPSLEFDLVKYYKELITDIKKIDHDKYRTLVHKRSMRRHIKSWICICPYYTRDGVPPDDDIVAKKGISTYRLFDNGMSVFQFESRRSAITPVEAAEAMGAIHKSLCFQSSGNVVKKLLEDNNSNTTLASMGDLNYRSKWKNNDKRATRCVKFYSVADDKKITDQDILDIVNTEKLFHNIHFREDNRDYGVAKKIGNQKIVPNTIKLSVGSKIRFTAITYNEFNTEKAAQGMNCFNTWRKGPKAKHFGNIASTAFSFDGLNKTTLERIMSQKKVKFLKAVRNEKIEDSYYGVIKTTTSVKGCNLVLSDKVIPEGKSSFMYKLEKLENENLAINFSREEKDQEHDHIGTLQ